MNTTEYEFQELELIPNCAAYVYGIADISYKVDPPDRDVGILEWQIFDMEIVGIALEGSWAKDPGRQLDSTEPLYKMIESALLRNFEHLNKCCLQHWESCID